MIGTRISRTPNIFCPKILLTMILTIFILRAENILMKFKKELEKIVGKNTLFLGLADIIGEYQIVEVRDKWVISQLEKFLRGKRY